MSNAAKKPIEGETIPAKEQGKTIPPKEQRAVAQVATPIDQMIAIAFDQAYDLDRIDRLLQMQRDARADQAREAFFAALAEWKKNPVQVKNDRKNTHYGNDYSSLGNMANTVNASMAPFGLSADWTPDQAEGRITVTCTLSHTLGHSKSATLSGPPDTSGSKNALQQIKSTLTYLELATFQAVTGVVAFGAANLDDDGNASGIKAISGAQLATLAKLLKETESDEAAFLEWAEVETIEHLPEDKFNSAIALLNRKKREQAAATKGAK